MTKKLLLLILVLGLTLPYQAMAQQRGTCGTMTDEAREAITKRLLKNKEAVKNGLVESRNDITYIPIKFHLIADDNGNGRVLETSVYDQLCKINTEYMDQDIQFFVNGGFGYLNSTVAYNSPSSTGGQFQLQARRKAGMVNVFITKTADTGGGGAGTTLGFYSPFGDWIVIRKDEVSNFNTTLVHELGHLFSLLHPHNGWDAIEGYDPDVYGNPAPNISPAGVPTEKNARTGTCKNCNTAGDYLCDTGPDYNFGFGSNNCNYGGVNDPCGEEANPNEDNFMGYFLDGCQNKFSEEQKAMVAADIAQRLNSTSINPNFTPSNTLPLDGPTTLQFPADGETIPTFGYVTFNWTDVANVDGYIFELDRFNSFNVQPRMEFVTDGSSSIQIDGLNANTKYYWKVTPYNQVSSCVGTTPVQSFTTGDMESTAVETITSVNTWSVQPNPVQDVNEITIKMDSREAFDADVIFYDITGKVVKQINQQRFNIGDSKVNISVNDLNNGMYVIAVRTENGILNNKIVVAR